MKEKESPDFFIIGGASGVIGTLCYIVSIFFQFSPAIAFLLAMAWPILTVIFAFSAYQYISIHHQSISNRLAFIFTVIAFTLVSIMISIQLVVRTGMEGTMSGKSGAEKDTLLLISHSLRWVDLGVDLAWDLFLGTGLLLLSMALWGHKKFGIWWSIPLALLSLILVLTNLITFPDPPGAAGLFDIGPVIAFFIIVFALRIVFLGNQLKKTRDFK